MGEGVTSITDARSHSQQISDLNQQASISESPLSPGEESLIFSEASNSWTFSRSIQNAMVEIAESYGHEVVFMGDHLRRSGVDEDAGDRQVHLLAHVLQRLRFLLVLLVD